MTFRRKLSLACLLLAACTSHAQNLPAGGTGKNAPPVSDARTTWEVNTIPVRNTQNGEPVTLGIAMRLPESSVPLKHIVIAPSPFTIPILKTASGSVALINSIPWIRTAEKLNAQGIGVVFADVPTDAANRQPGRRAQDMTGDLKQSLVYLAKKYPDVPVSVGIYSSNTIALLQALEKNGDVKRAIVVSGDFQDARVSNWRNLKTAVMLVHAPSAQCDISPFYEAEYVAKANNFTLVKAGYQQQEKRMSCDTGAQSRLTGLDDEFAGLVATWLNNQSVPATIGYPTPQTAWREQLMHYNVDGKTLEMTLLLPDGPGPYPVMIFNHGDIEMGTPYLNDKRRFREMIVAREFLQYGVAVAIPARPGVGMSEGIYLIPNSRGDADASYKGRLHAKSVMPAIDLLKTIPELDTTRIIITGQSAGGYTTMYIASQNPPGVIGAVCHDRPPMPAACTW